MERDELTDNEKILYDASDRLEAAAETFDQTASLLTDKDMTNDALVKEIAKRMDQVSKDLEAIGTFIRGYAKHRLS